VRAAAVLACCGVHAGIVGAVVGRSIGAWAGVAVAVAAMAVLVVVVWRGPGRCGASPFEVGHGREATL
jgi:hypothetical protein